MKKIIFLFTTLLLAAGGEKYDEKSQYLVPTASISVYSSDLNLNESNDIIVGSTYNFQTQWSGITLFENTGSGIFQLTDSIFIYGGQICIYAEDINGDMYPEIIGQYYDGQQSNAAIVKINDGNINISYYPMCDKLTSFTLGDVSGNNFPDILFISNNNQLWGIIYNDGNGNFSAPETFSLGFFPNDIACGDVTGNGKADVVLAGANTIIVFSTEAGFQQEVLGYTPSFSGGYTILITDFDNDGDKDILVSVRYFNNHNRIYMFENLGGGQFLQRDYFEFTPFCSYAVAADFNNDSLPDLAFIASDHSGIHIYRNKGEFLPVFQQFIPKADLTLRGLYCADFDNNGFIDLAFTSGWGQPDYYLHILFNDGNGNFLEDPIISYQTLNFEPQTSNLTCYPNPFTESVNIEFALTEQTMVDLAVFDLNGNQIAILIHKTMPPGGHTITWSGKDLNGKEVKPGIYLLGFVVSDKPDKTLKLMKT